MRHHSLLRVPLPRANLQAQTVMRTPATIEQAVRGLREQVAEHMRLAPGRYRRPALASVGP